MNKKNLIIEIVLAVLVIWLVADRFVRTDTKTAGETNTSETSVSEQGNQLKIAYINVDSLLLEYKLAQELNKKITDQQKQSQRELETKMQRFQKNYQDFQEKVQRRGFLTQASAEAQQQELLAEQQQLEQLNQELSGRLMQQEQQLNQELYDTISNYVIQFNKQRKYDLILSNTMIGTVMYGKAKLNITNDVLRKLNERYDKRMNQ
ncbi:MAG: OmpH family outer membrane protein [Salinivirgaceae bacterium]|nr:OmpH family outer membrane protein [Salinivirgaceae bacterium]